MTNGPNVSYALTARPLKAELAQLLKRLHNEIHPDELTVPEVLSLLYPLRSIVKRLDGER